jgi:hypothetical protein
MTREKALEIIHSRSAMALRVDEDDLGILILAYDQYLEMAVEYYFSKRVDYVEQQILSPVVVHAPNRMIIVEDHLEYDV